MRSWMLRAPVEMQLRNSERLAIGDIQCMDGRQWEVEASEVQMGKVQVLWKAVGGQERRWTEHDPGMPLRIRPGTVQRRMRMIKNAAAISAADRMVRNGKTWTAVSVSDAPGGVLIGWDYDGAVHTHLHNPAEGLYVETTAELPRTQH